MITAARTRFTSRITARMPAALLVALAIGTTAMTAPADAKTRKATTKSTRVTAVIPAKTSTKVVARTSKVTRRTAVATTRTTRAIGIRKASIVIPARPSLAASQGLRFGDDGINALEDDPGLKSSVAMVFDEGSKEVLYSRNAKVALPIASITKLMTSLVVLEARQPMDELVTVTNEDLDTEKFSSSRLAIGTSLPRRDMLHLALMSSENRAAHALARNYPGGLGAALSAMNAKAQALGMSSAQFHDPTGLSSQNVASAEDLVKLVNAASYNATIREFSTDHNYSVPVGRRMLDFHNTNSLVASPAWEIVVQKTGYISEAGKCLVMKAMIEGRSVVIVLLDSFGKYTRLGDANRIRQWMESQSVDPIARMVKKTS